MSMYKIMPSEGEVEKFLRLQRETGFIGLNLSKAATGKRIDLEDEKKALEAPGKLVSVKELNKIAGVV